VGLAFRLGKDQRVDVSVRKSESAVRFVIKCVFILEILLCGGETKRCRLLVTVSNSFSTPSRSRNRLTKMASKSLRSLFTFVTRAAIWVVVRLEGTSAGILMI
jgi:hypothetical protein